MAQAQKLGKCKNLMRSAREKPKNSSTRKSKINHARQNHIRNAKSSCGAYFALQLEKSYAKNPDPGTKVGKRSRK